MTLHTVLLYVAALLIGLSKAGFGGGTGILVTPLLASILPAREAVGLMLPLLFATDIMALFHYWGKWNRRNVLSLVPGAFVGILIGILILNMISDVYLKKFIGAMACLFGIIQVIRSVRAWGVRDADPSRENAPPVPSNAGISLLLMRYLYGTVAGMVTGIISTLAHIGGVITTMYLLPQGLSNQAFVGTCTAVYFLINLMKIGPYIKLGLLTGPVLRQDLLLLPAIFVGVVTGIALNRRISQKLFSRIILVLVLITGIKLLIGG